MMKRNAKERFKIGFLGSVAFHLSLVLLAVMFALLGAGKDDDKIIEVAVFGGGGGGGGQKPPDPTAEDFAKARAADLAGEAVQSTEKRGAPAKSASKVPELDEIIDKITKEYERNYATSTDAAADANKEEQTSQNNEQSKNIAGINVTENTGTGGGYGTGSGMGYGSGTGSGSGSGSGGGHGSGQGSGIGDGAGPGVGTGYGGGEATDSPAVPPRILRHVQPDYPEAARRAGREGTTTVRMLISADGEVEDAVVSNSSGYGNLDQAAVEACLQWSFEAARNSAGQQIRCYTYVPIQFKLRG